MFYSSEKKRHQFELILTLYDIKELIKYGTSVTVGPALVPHKYNQVGKKHLTKQMSMVKTISIISFSF